MFQRALVYLLAKAGLYNPARIVCRARISSLKRKIDLFTCHIDKCVSDTENIRYSEPGVFASNPLYQNTGEMQRDYFRRRYYAREEYSKMLKVMDRLRHKQREIGQSLIERIDLPF